jgi:hypothetical protein
MMRCPSIPVCIPDDVDEDVKAKAHTVGLTTIGGLDCIGDGEEQLAANTSFATTSCVLKVSTNNQQLLLLIHFTGSRRPIGYYPGRLHRY